MTTPAEAMCAALNQVLFGTETLTMANMETVLAALAAAGWVVVPRTVTISAAVTDRASTPGFGGECAPENIRQAAAMLAARPR